MIAEFIRCAKPHFRKEAIAAGKSLPSGIKRARGPLKFASQVKFIGEALSLNGKLYCYCSIFQRSSCFWRAREEPRIWRELPMSLLFLTNMKSHQRWSWRKEKPWQAHFTSHILIFNNIGKLIHFGKLYINYSKSNDLRTDIINFEEYC